MEKIIDDPNLVAKLAAQANAEQPVAKEIRTTLPTSNLVTLPGGFLDELGNLITEAEVRELNGADEEEIAKAPNSGKALLTILKRGTVKLGTRVATDSDLDNLLIGDRDAVLLGIYKATFGNEVTIGAFCQTCNSQVITAIDLNSVETKSLSSLAERTFNVELKSGVAVVTLPNGITQKRLLELDGKSAAENVTAILSGCIVSVNGEPSMGPSTALKLSMVDRQTILNEIYSRTPGPRLGEVTKACEACGTEMETPLSLAALFRI